MRFRKLRIAWSAVCGIAAVLVISWCVRSYRHADIVRPKFVDCEAISVRGRLKITRMVGPFPASPRFDSYAVGERLADVIEIHVRQFSNSAGFGSYNYQSRSVVVPHLFVALLMLLLGAAPWVRRFTLRTLLIATALVAAALAAISYTA